MQSGVILKFSPVWLRFVESETLLPEQSCPHVGVGACFGLCPPTADAPKGVWQGSSCSVPLSLPLSLSPLYLFPPSHLIAFDKCPYWLHIIRCGGDSLRLYYSAHIPHLFSILHGWHTCFCKVRKGPRLCQWNSFMSRRFHWLREVLVSALDMAFSITANLLEGVDQT